MLYMEQVLELLMKASIETFGPESKARLHWIVTWFLVWYELRVPFQCYSDPSGEAGEWCL